MTPDEALTPGQAAQLVPGRPSAQAIWRWCRKGLKARTGKIIKLDHFRVGARIYTSQAGALEPLFHLIESLNDWGFLGRPPIGGVDSMR